MAKEIKNSPGNVHLKCMLFEPHPFAYRARQDDSIILNRFTIGKKSDSASFYFNNFEPYGVSLRPKYIYRDTILKINGENLQSNRQDLKDFLGRPLFNNTITQLDSSGKSVTKKTGDPQDNNPWLIHQTFDLHGSLFNSNNITISEAINGSKSLDKLTPALFNYKTIEVEYASNGDFLNKNDDFYSGVWYNSNGEIDTAKSESIDPAYSLKRRTFRFMPYNINVPDIVRASIPLNVAASAITIPVKPIHWLVKKTTPLFREEDFFVTFQKQANIPSIISSKINLLKEYEFLDSELEGANAFTFDENTNAIIRKNSGVYEIVNSDQENAKNEKDTRKVSLANDAYYIIEINEGSANHNYFIIIPYNGNPVFIHAGRFAEIAYFDEQNSTVLYPKEKISRKLSTYPVSGADLINGNNGNLTIAVRSYLGRLIVIFNGDDANPWVIERSDYDLEAFYNSLDTGKSFIEALQNGPAKKFIPMSIEPRRISLGAGNIMAGFSFGPLHYVSHAKWDMDNPVIFKGPFKDDNDFNSNVGVLLRENVSVKPNGSTSSVENPFTIPKIERVYNQRAEVFVEHEGSQIGNKNFVLESTITALIETSIENTDNRYLIPGLNYFESELKNGLDPMKNYKYSYGNNFSIYNSDQERLSYIRISPSDFNTIEDSFGENVDQSQKGYINTDAREGKLALILGAGDMTVGKGINKPWKIQNCITPIANSFRIFALESSNPAVGKQIVTDVSNYVSNLNLSWNFTDGTKAEHSGNIKFLLNFGKPTGIEKENEDHSKLLASLTDKAFYLRIYAWWDCGFMNCDDSCGCKKILGKGTTEKDKVIKGDPDIIFTGLCFGGTVSVQAGVRHLECQLVDYWQVLKDQRWFNSPFFDGMRDWNAVNTILEMAGFYDGGNNKLGKQNQDTNGNLVEKYPPLSMIKTLANFNGSTYNGQGAIPGEKTFEKDYALPSAFNILQNPLLKFEYGSSYDESIIKMATYSGKMVYFDRYGIFRLTTRPEQIKYQLLGNDKQGNEIFRKIVPKCNFYASPLNLPDCFTLSRIIKGSYTTKRAVQDVPNNLFIATATPNGEFLTGTAVNSSSIRDDTSEGYVGYPKYLIQENGIFGSQQALESIVEYYTGFFTPPIVVTWEAYGVGHLMAGDIVAIRGLDLDDTFPKTKLQESEIDFQNGDGTTSETNSLEKTVLVYITQIDSEINPEKNDWTSRYTGEWIYTGNI